jgi:hypothetical protein
MVKDRSIVAIRCKDKWKVYVRNEVIAEIKEDEWDNQMFFINGFKLSAADLVSLHTVYKSILGGNYE